MWMIFNIFTLKRWEQSSNSQNRFHCFFSSSGGNIFQDMVFVFEKTLLKVQSRNISKMHCLPVSVLSLSRHFTLCWCSLVWNVVIWELICSQELLQQTFTMDKDKHAAYSLRVRWLKGPCHTMCCFVCHSYCVAVNSIFLLIGYMYICCNVNHVLHIIHWELAILSNHCNVSETNDHDGSVNITKMLGTTPFHAAPVNFKTRHATVSES